MSEVKCWAACNILCSVSVLNNYFSTCGLRIFQITVFIIIPSWSVLLLFPTRKLLWLESNLRVTKMFAHLLSYTSATHVEDSTKLTWRFRKCLLESTLWKPSENTVRLWVSERTASWTWGKSTEAGELFFSHVIEEQQDI